MALKQLLRASHPVRVVLSTPAVMSFVSVWKAAALAIAQLGVGAFFVAGVTRSALGPTAAWWVLAACLLSAFVRAIDMESWALLIPGGTIGRVERAFGPRASRFAAAATLVERLLLATLASVVVGHYAAGALVPAIRGRLTGSVTPEDIATLLAVMLIGLLWTRARVGLVWARDTMATGIWIGVGILFVASIWALLSLGRGAAPGSVLLAPPPMIRWTPWPAIDTALLFFFGLGLALPAIGGGDAVSRAAHEFAPPRLQALRRTSLCVLLFTVVITALTAFSYMLLVPGDEQDIWMSVPLAGLAHHVVGPVWTRNLLSLAVSAAAVLMLAPAVQIALADAESLLQRLSIEGTLSSGFAQLHRRLGTPVRVIDMAAAATVVMMLASGGRVAWLARAYTIAISAVLFLKIVTLMRLRRAYAGTPYRAPLNGHFRGREIPWGLLGLGALLAATSFVALLVGDAASIATAAVLVALMLLFRLAGRDVATSEEDDQAAGAFDLVPATEISLDQIHVRPGNVLVPVRNPHALDHVAAALRAAGDRDVVVMTVRLADTDLAVHDSPGESTPSRYERQLLSEVVAVAERLGRPVRLLIVPARNVVEAIVTTVLRLRSSDVYVGESSTLSAEDQARMLGDAWERADKLDLRDVRLVITHHSGRTHTYHMGAHPPSLSPADLDLIHRVWLDAIKAVGPHVHHHDVVRAALTQMEQQLTGPNRDDALASIRDSAMPAEELAAVLHARDYGRLRDMMRNRHASDVAELLTALTLEDQVVVFRVLPRKDAAAVFEYLSQDAKEALLKAMAQEDVASLLNNMAPDDRTMFLEELPAAATRQLLSLLTPEERSVALTLLGYPENSVGRLMTPHYVAVREQWTVQEVLDYVRAHGHDSETLNTIYVVDEQGLLIDDVRIREFLLAPVDKRVADLMDRRFVTLTATDDQQTAVAMFRQYDRTALPVTDTAGMLIGIVTIDDVLDVAEAAATRDIQRVGGSEALEEPYMDIAFGRMIQKRAGWLTALFIGEMLTATAMGAFEAEISRAVVLALFVPLIISSGGNSGSQASTLVIRALALGEVGIADWWRVMRRELLAGLTLGAILGSIGFLRITLWSAFSNIYGEHWLLVAITVAVSLVGVVLWGTLSGSLLPFVLRRLGFDPAASSAPFVATLVDVTGLVIYFSVALVVLRGTLL
jgi:magnesium transporter